MIKYNSRFLRTRNYVGNLESNTIRYPEIGTWAEDWSGPVRNSQLRCEIQDETEIGKNRCRYLARHWPTDNTAISVLPVHGWIMAMTEANLVNLLDPETLELVHSIDIKKSKNVPDGVEMVLMTAHGNIDQNGDYWNMFSGLDISAGLDRPPKIVYGVYKIPGADRSRDSPMDPQELLDSIEFSSFAHNSSPLDIQIRYFHMFSISENYLVLPLTSVAIELVNFVDACRHAKPPTYGMAYRDDRKAEFRVFSKKEFKFIDQVWETDAHLQMHMIQAFEEENGVVVLDTLKGTNGDSIDAFFYEVIYLC